MSVGVASSSPSKLISNELSDLAKCSPWFSNGRTYGRGEEQLRLLEVLECHKSVEREVEHHFVSGLVQHASRIGIIALELDRRVVELTLNFVTTLHPFAW